MRLSYVLILLMSTLGGCSEGQRNVQHFVCSGEITPATLEGQARQAESHAKLAANFDIDPEELGKIAEESLVVIRHGIFRRILQRGHFGLGQVKFGGQFFYINKIYLNEISFSSRVPGEKEFDKSYNHSGLLDTVNGRLEIYLSLPISDQTETYIDSSWVYELDCQNVDH
jgi:hypothetical protein